MIQAVKLKGSDASVRRNSIRSTVRMTGVANNTVTKVLMEVGAACTTYRHRVLRGLTCQRIQTDEIWIFVFAKQKNVTLQRASKLCDGFFCRHPFTTFELSKRGIYLYMDGFYVLLKPLLVGIQRFWGR